MVIVSQQEDPLLLQLRNRKYLVYDSVIKIFVFIGMILEGVKTEQTGNAVHIPSKNKIMKR